MLLSVADCANRSGVTARTIQKYIKQGKLSATRGEDGRYSIDQAEFHRVFPNANVGESETKEDANRREQCEDIKDNEIKYLKEQICLLKDQLEDYKSRESKLLEMANSTTKLLTYNEQNKPKRRWFGKS